MRRRWSGVGWKGGKVEVADARGDRGRLYHKRHLHSNTNTKY